MEKLCSLLNKYLFYLVLFLLVFIPLYPKFPLFNVPKTYVAVRIEDLFILIAGFTWFLGNLFNFKKIFSQTIFKAFLLFWGIGLLSLLSALFLTYFVEPSLGFLHWARRVEYMSLFIIAATTIYSQKQIKIAIYTILVTAFIVVLYGFGQIWLDFPVISTTNKEFSKGLVLFLTQGARVNSTFAGHYDLAIYLSIVLIILGGLFLYQQKIINRIMLGIGGVLGFILLGLTAARVSFLASLTGLAILFWLLKKKLLVGVLIIASILLVGVVPDLRHRLVATVTVNLLGGGGIKYNPPPGTVTIFTPKSQLPSNPVDAQKAIAESAKSATKSAGLAADTVPGEPVNTTELSVYRSYGIRLDVEWPKALNAVYKNPLLGTGYSSLGLASDNDFLRSLGEVGILGTLSLALIFYILFKRIWQFLKISQNFERYFVLSVFCATIVVLLTALFIDVLEASKVAEVLWLLLGLSWAVINNYQIEGQQNV